MKNRRSKLADAARRRLEGIGKGYVVTTVGKGKEPLTSARLTCTACSETAIVEPSGVMNVTIEHAGAPFLAAVNNGTADEWVAANGYPIRTETTAGQRS
jgi:hypothetical protein